MEGMWTEKLVERYIGPYRVKRIISSNTIELELPGSMKIHPVVNVSRIQRYRKQVKGQKKIPLALVIIEEEKEYKVERLLNKRRRQGKWEYLVR